MNYRLIVLTHGSDPDPLNQTLESFRSHVDLLPTSAYLYADGAEALGRAWDAARRHDWTSWTVDASEEPQGFCKATRECWREGATAPEEHVFWLEHDFLLGRYLELEKMARALDNSGKLAQMALMRDAVNSEEKAAGGLFESRRDQYTPCFTDSYEMEGGEIITPPDYLVHQSYFTTNPSLMRRSFMAKHAWPGYDDQCEGLFGIDLMRSGYSFGVWGDGQPWCRHIGTRTGFGY